MRRALTRPRADQIDPRILNQETAILCRWGDMGSRVMMLGRNDQCVRCGLLTPARTRAFWNAEARHVLCLNCHEADLAPSVVPPPLPPPVPTDVGVAGGGARAASERLAARGTNEVVQAKWERGADGEEQLGALLDRELAGAVCLHDRKVPGTKANIDHVVVTGQSVWIVDAKNWKGVVERRDKGRNFKLDDRLYVNGRDRTKAVTAMSWQVEAVRKVLEPIGFAEFPIRPALCFINPGWKLFGRPFKIDGVLVTYPKKLVAGLQKDASSEPSRGTVQLLANELSSRLAAAVPAR